MNGPPSHTHQRWSQSVAYASVKRKDDQHITCIDLSILTDLHIAGFLSGVILYNKVVGTVVALAAGSKVTLLSDQVKRFKPELVAVGNETLVGELRDPVADAH